jgi:hypothetical protein
MSGGNSHLRMSTVEIASLPPGALLEAYSTTDAYTDCYSIKLARSASLGEFMVAFYTTPVFKLERWLLDRFASSPSTDAEALLLARGQVNRFAAWQVEAREADQAVLAAGRTRSWFMVIPRDQEPDLGTTLFFGSAVLPHKRDRLGWQFTALLGFHKLYSRILLGAAARRLAQSHGWPS